MQHDIGRVQHLAEQVELAAQDLEGQALRLVVRGQEVDHRDVVLLAVTMAAPDALLDSLRIPGQIVIDDRVAKLQVQTFRAGFGGNEDSRPGFEFVHQRQADRHRPARLLIRRKVAADLFFPSLQCLIGSGRLVGPPEKRHRFGNVPPLATSIWRR